MTVPRVQLGQIAQSIGYGLTASASREPIGPKFLRITDIQDGGVDWGDVPWCKAGTKAVAAARLGTGDIVFARTGATTGKSFLITSCPMDAVFASYLIRVRLGATADPSYVSHFFQTEDYWRQITKSARGVAQPGVNATTLKKLEIPLPPLPEQKRIAAILDAADALRAKRREALAQLDTLLQATFLDTFGDPVANPMGWETAELADLCLAIFDIDHNMPKSVDSGYPFISAKDLLDDGTISFDGAKHISKRDFQRLARKGQPRKGDILYSRIGTVGKARLVEVEFDFLASYSCCTIKPNAELVDNRYLCTLLDSPFMLRQAMTSVRAIAVPDLGLGKIRAFRIITPPRDLQLAFAHVVRSVERQKASQRAHLAELDTLFASLQSRAFRGEL